MIHGLINYFDLLTEKREKMNKEDKNYINVCDTISWCKNYREAIEKLNNIKDTRLEIVGQKENALKSAKISNDISDWAVHRYWDLRLMEYDFLQKAVIEQMYLCN